MYHGVRTRRSIHVVYEYINGCMNYNAPMVLERHWCSGIDMPANGTRV